jgi:GNAT superfamily N-acetyltransferase
MKEAYEADTSDATPDEIHGRRAFVDRGGIIVLARDALTKEPAGCGVCEVPVADLSELATVGVRPSFEGRGIARAVTARLAAKAFAAQVHILWLAPLHGAADRVYRRVGFAPKSETLHISLD